MNAALVVISACEDSARAEHIAETLVAERLAACVNLLPGVESTFRWEGKIDRSREALLLIKTTSRRFAPLARALTRLHPYAVPEIIALPVTAGAAPYLRWLSQSVALR